MNQTVREPKRRFDRVPLLYVVVAVVIAGLLAVLVPPFSPPDEANHAKRAIELSHGVLFGQKVGKGAGDQIDTGVLTVMDGFAAMAQHVRARYPIAHDRPDGRVDPAEVTALEAVHWEHGTRFTDFQNTAPYAPFAYLPQVVAWKLGELGGWTVLHTLLLARLLMAAAAIAIGWLALKTAGAERFLLLGCLLLPTELGLNATCSQDALLLPLAALIGAILARAIVEQRSLTTTQLVSCATLIAVCILARIAYLPLAFAVLLPELELRPLSRGRLLRPLLAVAGTVLVVGAWQAKAATFGAFLGPGANPSAQLSYLLHDPVAAVRILIFGTLKLGPNLAVKGLEALGEGDAFPPGYVYALLALGLAGMAGFSGHVRLRSRLAQGLVVGMIVATMALLTAAMYLTWTAYHLDHIEGLQSRYYFPLLPFAFLLLPRLDLAARLGRPEWSGRLLTASVAIFVLTVLTTPVVAARRFENSSVPAAIAILAR